MRAKDALGRYGEELAASYLTRAGLAIVARNWRCPEGEIDILAREGNVLVVCEVKTRSSGAYGLPQEAVTATKAARLRRLATWWLAQRRIDAAEIRFDVIGIQRGMDGAIRLDHLRGVV